MSVSVKIVKRLTEVTPKELLLAGVFAVALVTSFTLGLQNHQKSYAFLPMPDGSSTAHQTLGSAPSGSGSSHESMGSAPTSTSVHESMGSAPMPGQATTETKTKELINTVQPTATKATEKTTTSTTNSTMPATTNTPATATPTTSSDKSADSDKGEPKTTTTTQATVAQAPQVQAASTTTAAALPNTGPGGIFGLFTGTSLLGFASHKLYLRRKR